MELNVDDRYQSPGEMLAELRSAMQKVDDSNGETRHRSGTGKPAAAAAGRRHRPRRTLMFVESNVQLQNIIRERLKNSGYRVLVTADPERALSRSPEATGRPIA